MEKNCYRIIALDLDGTLLNDRKEISPRTYRALAEAHRMGAEIVPSTGRIYNTLPETVARLPFLRYIIEANGAQVYDIREHKVLHQALLDLDKAMEIYRYLDEIDCIYDCYLDGWGYMDETMYAQIDRFISDPRVNQMVKTLRRPVHDFKGFLARENRPLQKIQMFFADMDRRARELERLPRLFPDMGVSSSIANNIEFNAKNANKGEALRFLCRHLGLGVEESMSFGDSGNDLSMIVAAGTGVAMANADPSLLAAADYITDTNDRDGVAKAIARFCPELRLSI